ncbi:MAG: CatB-related O-acetyltransferase [Clostridiales bacterium]|nr:CatB-related O-acetyltransferase [Clostridiales bacterium]
MIIYSIPDPNAVFPNAYGTTCFLKNVIKAPNILVGDYTYYDDPVDPTRFEQNNVLFNWPEFGDRLLIGKFCSIASGVQFIMNTANHRISSVTTYPFHVFGGAWAEHTPPHLEQLPFKGDTVVGNDVWIGKNSTILPGVQIGDGAIIAAHSVVTKDVGPYQVVGGNPARFLKKRFDDALIALLLQVRWWDFPPEKLVEVLPLLCDPDLDFVRAQLQQMLEQRP